MAKRFEIRIQEVDDGGDGLFGSAPIIVKYKPPIRDGKKTSSWQSREAGINEESNRQMLDRMMGEIMRQVFPVAEKKQTKKS